MTDSTTPTPDSAPLPVQMAQLLIPPTFNAELVAGRTPVSTGKINLLTEKRPWWGPPWRTWTITSVSCPILIAFAPEAGEKIEGEGACEIQIKVELLRKGAVVATMVLSCNIQERTGFKTWWGTAAVEFDLNNPIRLAPGEGLEIQFTAISPPAKGQIYVAPGYEQEGPNLVKSKAPGTVNFEYQGPLG